MINVVSPENQKLEMPYGHGHLRRARLIKFANAIINIQNKIGFKMSVRGWCYQLEGFGLLIKSDFDKVQSILNECRKRGFLPVDMVAEDASRAFRGVEVPDDESPKDFIEKYLEATLNAENYYTPKWWWEEEYYIQMLVEKVDLKTLFAPVCARYHIPIATSKGWSSITQRATYARRFKEAEEMGLKSVLLYCGDHDPDGLRISEFLRKNLSDISNIHWIDKKLGYDPAKLIIDRFGLNFSFIEEHNLSWINNLITGSKRNLASPNHRNYYNKYVQDYLSTIGERKCEANAIVVKPEAAEKLCIDSIERYLGKDARERFQKRRDSVDNAFDTWREEFGVGEALDDAQSKLEDSESEEINYEED